MTANIDDSWLEHILKNLDSKPTITGRNKKFDVIVYDPGEIYEKKYISRERLKKLIESEGYGQ